LSERIAEQTHRGGDRCRKDRWNGEKIRREWLEKRRPFFVSGWLGERYFRGRRLRKHEPIQPLGMVVSGLSGRRGFVVRVDHPEKHARDGQ
jgi:hypothetical protein